MSSPSLFDFHSHTNSCQFHLRKIFGICHSSSASLVLYWFKPSTFLAMTTESWQLTKKADHQRIDAFELWCWRRLLRVWVFIGRTDVEAETPILRPPDAKSWLIGKDPDDGKDWRQEEKRTTEDEMVGWHHRLDGHGFRWTPGVADRPGGLACCGSWGHKESDTSEQLNWTELIEGLVPDTSLPH